MSALKDCCFCGRKIDPWFLYAGIEGMRQMGAVRFCRRCSIGAPRRWPSFRITETSAVPLRELRLAGFVLWHLEKEIERQTRAA